VSRKVTCPQCGKLAGPAPENAWRPFCSERCKMTDLGQWFAERYSIPEDSDPEPPPDQNPRQ
jgi:uncharacterized protein